MKRLCELVDVSVNNEACVLFKVKDNARMDLISLGCFKGNEELIRMSKGRTPEITIFYNDGKNFSYHFGEGSTTVISGSYPQQREMIRECAILDFGIVCDLSYASLPYPDEMFIANTLGVQKMTDADRGVSLVSGGGMSGHIKINSQIVAHDVHVKDVARWFEKRGYHVEFEQDISKGLPCGKVYGECVPMKEYEISQMPHELSDDRLVAYVQAQLGCDKDLACVFISGYEDARHMRDAKMALGYYGTEIMQAGLNIPKLTDEDLLELGRRLDQEDRNILADFAEDEVVSVVDWVRSKQAKSLDKTLDEAKATSEGYRGQVTGDRDYSQDKG